MDGIILKWGHGKKVRRFLVPLIGFIFRFLVFGNINASIGLSLEVESVNDPSLCVLACRNIWLQAKQQTDLSAQR